MADNPNKQEEFKSKIGNAIDDLFVPKRKIEIDPLTNEVKEDTSAPEPEEQGNLSMETKKDDPLYDMPDPW